MKDIYIYIGSTTKEFLSQRMTKHRDNYKVWKNGKCKKSTTSYLLFDKYGVENCKIVLLENVNASSKDELLARESFYIQSSQCINKNIPGRSKQESDKTYAAKNKEKLNQSKRNYYEQNKETLKLNNSIHYHENKQNINDRRNQVVICICGIQSTQCNLKRHEKTKKHIDFMEVKNSQPAE